MFERVDMWHTYSHYLNEGKVKNSFSNLLCTVFKCDYDHLILTTQLVWTICLTWHKDNIKVWLRLFVGLFSLMKKSYLEDWQHWDRLVILTCTCTHHERIHRVGWAQQISVLSSWTLYDLLDLDFHLHNKTRHFYSFLIQTNKSYC